MGWSSGTYIAEPLVNWAKDNIQNESSRSEFYKILIDTLEGQDWDTVDEVMGIDPIMDDVIKTKHPSWFVDEDE